MHLLIFILCFALCCTFAASRSKHQNSFPCRQYSLVRYRVTFEGSWSETNFPKQYPTVRPPAQWSKMIGRSHNEDYTLWSLGKLSSTAFKKFAQEGSSENLEKLETQGFDGIFDSFSTPPLTKGVGEMDSDFFASYSHQFISLAIRLIPSPDWFAGLDGFQLCRNDSWIREITVPVVLVDAGTDRGFTFTSPKWASRPQEKMYQITNHFPNHRASSFHYPDIQRLPNIGHFRFELLTDYKLHKVHKQVKNYRDANEIPQLEEDIEKRREELEEQQILHGEPVAVTKQPLPPLPQKLTKVTQKTFLKNNEVQNSNTYSGNNKNHPSNIIKNNDLLPKPERKDCTTNDWTSWTDCSKSCGFGVQKRYRKVTQIPVQGRPCPSLVQEKWCGGMRNCRDQMKLFSWLNRNT